MNTPSRERMPEFQEIGERLENAIKVGQDIAVQTREKLSVIFVTPEQEKTPNPKEEKLISDFVSKINHMIGLLEETNKMNSENLGKINRLI